MLLSMGVIAGTIDNVRLLPNLRSTILALSRAFFHNSPTEKAQQQRRI